MATMEFINNFSKRNINITISLSEQMTILKERLDKISEHLEKCRNYSGNELMTVDSEYADDEKIVKHDSSEAKKRSTINDNKKLVKRLKSECRLNVPLPTMRNIFSESKLLQEARARSFSHWSRHIKPSKEQFMAAGFFQCNVGDRTICLYCNLIAQQWRPDDDPSVVHRTLSPNCYYVLSMLNAEESSSVSIVNENFMENNTTVTTTPNNLYTSDQMVYRSAVHEKYATIPSRETTFDTWDTELLPAVSDLVQAGFFYIGKTTITTCFYCGGSLQNWAKKDKPIVEHVRWFPNCKYAKQFAGDELYNKIQEIKRAQAEREAAITQTENNNINHRLQIVNDQTLSRFVAARLDLPSSQRLLDQPFKLSIIKRCWEDQLRLKCDDFKTDTDLYIACLILQKQIDHINGNKDNIVIPNIKMKQIRDGIQIEEPTVKSTIEPMVVENTTPKTQIPVTNPCVLCEKEEKRLACIPCGHLVVCSSCYPSVKTCPTCRRGVEAFVRVFL